MTTYPYTDPLLPVEQRAEDLLGRMTLDEKVAQLGAVNFPDLIDGDRFDPQSAVRIIPHGIGQVTRIGATTGLHPAQSAELLNGVQKMVVEQTRLGIPIIVHEESLAGYCARDATVFPQALHLGASWDPALVEEVASTIRRQMLAVGARHSLAPVLDVARDPRWGRLEETYGEDPVLVGTLGAAYVRGLQTADLSKGVIATGKHFLAHGASEGGRNHAPVQVGPRELREVYAEPFAMAIRESQLRSIMSSYHCVDGLPGSGSAALLTDLLRQELGFDGMVVADYFSVSLLSTAHRVAASRADAAIKALSAGLDVELPALDCFSELKGAVDSGELPVDVIDTAVRRVLIAKLRLGLFENPYVNTQGIKEVFDDPAAVELARRAATRGIVLLKNDGVLPLAPVVSRIAIIGPAADDINLLQGDYHYPTHQQILPGGDSYQADGHEAPAPDLISLPSGKGAFKPGPYFTEHVTPLSGIAAALAGKAEIVFEKGCELVGEDQSGIPAAVEAARSADVAIVVVGGRSGLHRAATVGEARDAVDLRLTGAQEQLVVAIAGTGTPTVAVVMSGRAHVLTTIAERASALLVAFPLGQQGGNALADVLAGRSQPGGRLPVTLPRASGQVPLYHSHRSLGSQSFFYGDYTDCGQAPLFSFGHGLSYTTFEFSDLDVVAGSTSSPMTVGVTVRNAGPVPGEEVVQLYVSDLFASVARPERSLVGFARAGLRPGEACRVVFDVHPSRLAFYNERMDFVVEPGEFRFLVGASASDIRQEREVTLAGAVTRYSQSKVVAVTSQVTALDNAH